MAKSSPNGPFKGNKQSLPQKPCAVCAKPLTWRKNWAKNWDAVLYCSDRCRAAKAAPRSGQPAQALP